MGWRGPYLSALGAIYACAFASFWLQLDGLVGDRGLLPASALWPRLVHTYGGDTAWASFQRLPTVFWFVVADDGRGMEAAVEGACAAGLGAALLIVAGFHHTSLFATCLVAYLSLYTVGQTWLSFQWDILLLESGFAALLVAPLNSLRATAHEDDSGHPMTWVLRAQWAKFMVMSGVVKVTARCPTWERLTALEFHFASTCLPTAEAWWIHQLPPVLLRLGVALMFLCELVAPALLLAPVTAVRRLGVLLQVALQVAIQATGNYNWFNMHTAVLLLPCWARDFGPSAPWEQFWSANSPVAVAVAVAFLGGAAVHLFPVAAALEPGESPLAALGRHDAYAVANRATPEFTRALVDRALSAQALRFLYGAVLVTSLGPVLARVFSQPRTGTRTGLLTIDAAKRLVGTAVALIYLGVVLLPASSILGRPVVLPWPVHDMTSAVAGHVGAFRAASSYGLFRRMTGVGAAADLGGDEFGWGGLPPSIVAVPAVVIEVAVDGADEWVEVPFRYAPFGEDRAPRRTAPHQPRLDWQMWFAALGSYQHQSWLLHLMYKLVSSDFTSDPALRSLLDPEAEAIIDGHRPRFVRATLYRYDFTRASTPWQRRNAPGSVPVPANCSLFRPAADAACAKYWHREPVREYVPAVDGDTLLAQVVRPQGWPENPPTEPPSRLTRLRSRVRAFAGVQLHLTPHSTVHLDGPLFLILASILAARLAGARLRRPKYKHRPTRDDDDDDDDDASSPAH